MDLLLNKSYELVDKYCSSDATHNRDHIERVLRLAEYLAKKEGLIDKLTLENLKLAVILHDLGQGHQIRQLKKSEDKMISGEHADHSLRIAEKFLKKEGFTKERTEEIKQIISSHGTHGSNNNLAGDILHDADLLDGIGLVGVLRKFTYGGQIGRGIIGSLEFSKNKIKNRQFRTKVGQQIGKKRIEKVVKWLNDVQIELDGIDFR